MILPQHQQPITVRLARECDIKGAKNVADTCKEELGFVNVATLQMAQSNSWLLVAVKWDSETNIENVIGFVNFRIKKDKNCTIYEIAIKKEFRGQGIGKRLLNEIIRILNTAGGSYIRLKCPEPLTANSFYEHNSFKLIGTEEGKKRHLNVWQYDLLSNYILTQLETSSNNRLQFFASMTVAPSEIRQMHYLWHKYAHDFNWLRGIPNPFQNILISPVVSSKKTIDFVRELRRTGETQTIMFDSGGYFVQRGDFDYSDLLWRLFNIYQKEDWADIYVLPDNPPLSSDTPAVADYKVKQTVEGSLRFYQELPETIKTKAMPVIQATKGEHIDYCIRNYNNKNYHFERIGFGSFPTSGSNNSINRLNVNSLMLLRQLIESLNKAKIHTFGISTPPAAYLLSLVGVYSLDSNGWMRSGGYGKVFLPFMRGYLVTCNSRRNLSLNETDFQNWKDKVGHYCPFCSSFDLLSESRWHRIMHNLIVMSELSDHYRLPRSDMLESLSSKYYRIFRDYETESKAVYKCLELIS